MGIKHNQHGLRFDDSQEFEAALDEVSSYIDIIDGGDRTIYFTNAEAARKALEHLNYRDFHSHWCIEPDAPQSPLEAMAVAMAGNPSTDTGYYLKQLRGVLELAKQGIVDATIECEIDSDMNNLDMQAMVVRGAVLKSTVAPWGIHSCLSITGASIATTTPALDSALTPRVGELL
jgi:hypothetical protein